METHATTNPSRGAMTNPMWDIAIAGASRDDKANIKLFVERVLPTLKPDIYNATQLLEEYLKQFPQAEPHTNEGLSPNTREGLPTSAITSAVSLGHFLSRNNMLFGLLGLARRKMSGTPVNLYVWTPKAPLAQVA
jgi:hypothetical protein